MAVRLEWICLVTSRDSTTGFGVSAETLHIQSFEKHAGTATFLALVGRKRYTDADQVLAEENVSTLGGLPLAPNQIAGFISQQRLALKEFLPLYQKNSAKIHTRKMGATDSSRTLSTVWEVSLSRLSGLSSTLQKLLAFLDPDRIPESLLKPDGWVPQGELEFLSDDMDFLDAAEELLRSALIERSPEDETLSVHRLVQSTVIDIIPRERRPYYLDTAISILSNGFPSTWNTVTSHQFTAWEKCELCLPHVKYLMAQSKRYSIQPSDLNAYSELLLRVCWHLYEKEFYNLAQEFTNTVLSLITKQDSLIFASASTLRWLIELGIHNVGVALEQFRIGLNIRQKLTDSDDAFIASSWNTISLVYTELGQMDKAVEAGQNAIDIRLRTNSDRIGNSYNNMSSTLLRMGRADEAEDVLKRCPSLKDFTDETFLNTGNPRFAGDMILLARIRLAQGRLDDAIRLSSKALTFRQQLFRHGIKTCDCLYQVATLLEQRGDLNLAAGLLEESVSMAENVSFGEGYSARSNHRLSKISKRMGKTQQGKVYEEAAKSMLRKKLGDATPVEPSQTDYDSVVPWMLW